MTVEYSVRKITRYIVTRYHENDCRAGSEGKGEFDNEDAAHEVAYALCRAEHEASGEPTDSPNFIYPKRDE